MTKRTSTKGNILLVANWESNVGYAWWLMENFWVTISNHFEQSEQKSFLIFPRITTIPESISNTQITTQELDFSDHRLNNLYKIYKLIKGNNIQYVYLSDTSKYSWFYIFLRFSGIKKIVVHDHTPGDRTTAKGWRKRVKSLIQHIPFYTADHHIAVTDFVNKRHLEVNCIPSKKCSVTNNGIEPLDLSRTQKAFAREQFNIPKESNIIVTTGRASYYKGIDFFIQCANELINTQGHNNLHFLFCGDGPDMDDFKSLCNRYGLDKHFTFSGKRSDIRKILPSCDVGFHASKGEVGYSLSILEYMSSGLPTIVPDRPSTCSSIEHMHTGLIYKHEDIQSACEMILKGLTHNIRDQLSQNAIREVHVKYNINQTNLTLISILNSVYN